MYVVYRLFEEEKQRAHGSTIKTITKEQLSNFTIPFPELPEQTKIAEILSTVDEKIENIAAQIEQTQQLKKGLMQRLLTKGIGHTKFKDSPLGEIPESWEVVKIEDITVNYDSKRIPIKSDERIKLKKIFPYYGAQGIIDHIDEYIFEGKFLLVAEDGENVKSRKNDIAFIANGKFWVNNHAHILQTVNGNDIDFLMYYLNYVDIKEYVTGMAQPKLNKSALNKIRIPLPYKKEQNEIANALLAIDEKLNISENKKSAYEQLKKGLMQKLLTGRMRVKV